METHSALLAPHKRYVKRWFFVVLRNKVFNNQQGCRRRSCDIMVINRASLIGSKTVLTPSVTTREIFLTAVHQQQSAKPSLSLCHVLIISSYEYAIRLLIFSILMNSMHRPLIQSPWLFKGYFYHLTSDKLFQHKAYNNTSVEGCLWHSPIFICFR